MSQESNRLPTALMPCPFCGWASDGMTRAEFFRHIVVTHAGEVEKAQGEVARIRAQIHDERKP